MPEPRPANVICPTCGPIRAECIRHLPRKRQKGFTKIRIKPEDKRTADAIKLRDGYKCRWCGKSPSSPQGLHCAHIFGRSRKVTRHLETNLLALCASCHRRAHDNQAAFHDWIKSWMGEEAFDALQQLSQTTVKKVRKTA